MALLPFSTHALKRTLKRVFTFQMPTFPVSSAGGGVACSLEGSSLFLYPLEMLSFLQTINRKSIIFYLTVIHFVCVFGIATLFLSPCQKNN